MLVGNGNASTSVTKFNEFIWRRAVRDVLVARFAISDSGFFC